MPTPVPPAIASDSTGLGDVQWVTDVRDGLRDYPKYSGTTWTADGTNGVLGPNSTPFVAPHAPLNDLSVRVFDATSSTTYTVITSGTPTSTQVLVNLDTGEFTWNTAPAASHAIQITYQYCKWRDLSIETALYAGLRAMFPHVGKTYQDISIPIQVNVWDYTLPIWAQDPRSRIIKVEYQDPYIVIEPWKPLQNWEMNGVGSIHLPRAQSLSPTARLRLTGWGPYLTLGDLEPQLYHLPIWYALSVLLPKLESFRLRQDTMIPIAQEGGQAPGLLTQTGDYYAKRFEIELQRLARVMGPGWSIPMRSTYDRRIHL